MRVQQNRGRKIVRGGTNRKCPFFSVLTKIFAYSNTMTFKMLTITKKCIDVIWILHLLFISVVLVHATRRCNEPESERVEKNDIELNIIKATEIYRTFEDTVCYLVASFVLC